MSVGELVGVLGRGARAVVFSCAVIVAGALSVSGAARSAATEDGVEVTYLANSGFWLRAGETAVLIDGCVREPSGIHAALPGPVHNKLTNAKPPFDVGALVLVSHSHPDHVQPRVLEKLLANNPRARLATSPQVIGALAAAAQDYDAIRERVRPLEAPRGSRGTLEEDGVRVEHLELDHSGQGHAQLTHLGHLIELGGVRVLHVGDAEPAPGNFDAYDLENARIDVALVPYWYFGSPGGAEVLREHIRARVVVACHVPPERLTEIGELLAKDFPDVVLFREALESRRFPPAAAPPAPGAGAGSAGG